MTIRLLTLDDALRLLQLRIQSDTDGTFGDSVNSLRERSLDTIKRCLLFPFVTFGAFIDEELVGAASVERMEFPEDTDCLGVLHVMVHPKFRGKGIAKNILEQCISYGQIKNAKSMKLIVNVPNPAAWALYESLGFKESGRETSVYEFSGVHMDEVEMTKYFENTRHSC